MCTKFVATIFATLLGFTVAAASHAAPPFDPQKQPFGNLPPLVLTGFNLSGTAGTQKVFQAWFDGNSWAGDVLAYPVTAGGSADVTNRLWSAAEVFKSKQGCGTATDESTATTNWFDTGRIVVTRSSTGLNKPFRWASIGAGHQAAIGDEKTLNFVRGDRSNEKENLVVDGSYDPAAPDPALIQYACGSASGTYRARNSIMGDVVHGKTVYIAAPPADYTFDKYQEFKTDLANRPPRVYVGANDGMVHAFDALTGDEVWAYIPSMVIPELKNLIKSPYLPPLHGGWWPDGGRRQDGDLRDQERLAHRDGRWVGRRRQGTVRARRNGRDRVQRNLRGREDHVGDHAVIRWFR